MSKLDGSIIIAVHKKCDYINLPGYLPIQVGADNHKELDLGITKDNIGDNISDKNNIYCELTGLYWFWKNGTKTDFSGLVHYRRYFVKKVHLFKNSIGEVITLEDVNNLFNSGKHIIMPRKINKKTSNGRLKKNIPDDNQDKPLFYTMRIIERDYPEYLSSYMNIALEDGKVSFGNMFITRYETFVDYCKWVFDILEKLEKELEFVEPRMMGFVSEYLLCCWVDKNFNQSQIKYMDVINTEDGNFKNYLKSIKNRL